MRGRQSDDATVTFCQLFHCLLPVCSLCVSADLGVRRPGGVPGAAAVGTHVSIQSRQAAELSTTHHAQQPVVGDTTVVIVEKPSPGFHRNNVVQDSS